MLEFIPLLDPIGNIIELQWDFGDGSAIVTAGPATTVIHTFPYDGNFTVKYGQEVQENLDYHSATLELGQCIFHALACAGLLRND